MSKTMRRGRKLGPLVKEMAEKIIEEVCAKHKISVKELKSSGNQGRPPQYIMRPLVEIENRLFEDMGLSCAQIGELVNRDFSSVYGILQKYREVA